jgi:hypothetical protein
VCFSWKNHQANSYLIPQVVSYQNIFAPVSVGGNAAQSWKKWVHEESVRRILAACFLLDIHTSCYFKQPPVSAQGLDYSSVARLHVPLSAGMDDLWNAVDYRTWNSLARKRPKLRSLSNTLGPCLTADAIVKAPPFDAAIMLAGCVLQLQTPKSPEGNSRRRNSVPSFSTDVTQLASLFQGSGTAHAYLAFHHTPVHEVLSVSGDSWLFNEKILQARIFMEHQQTFTNWSKSKEATVAAFFAVRGIASFLNLTRETAGDLHEHLVAGRLVTWTDISDYWGLYVCTLICWAWGQGTTKPRADRKGDASKRTAIDWILTATQSDLIDLGEWTRRRETRAVVCLVQDVLERGCPGGRNRMFSDAVSVLKKLSDRGAASF